MEWIMFTDLPSKRGRRMVRCQRCGDVIPRDRMDIHRIAHELQGISDSMSVFSINVAGRKD
jgi:ribosomal protein S26